MALIMGMNSGSSFDGIDVILAETKIAEDGFPRPLKFLKGASYSWPREVEELIIPAFDNKVDMVGLNRLTYIAGAVMADSARKFMQKNKIDPKDITVLGVDGQTIYQEQPDHAKISEMTDEEKDDWVGRWLNGPYAAGYQIGDTSVIANLTNITTVTNFRQADHVFGGSAAPLMQYFDFIMFRHKDTPTLTLNIGGIANMHLACKDRRRMFAFDTGPGNLMSDHAARRLLGQSCDFGGEAALRGKADEEMLLALMEHPFFKRPVPRSGWKLDFSAEYCDGMMERFSHLSTEDMMATICAFTAEAIVRNLHDYIPEEVINSIDVMYASGGGVKNAAIMKHIQQKLPENIRLTTSAEIGIPPEYKEACKFATLAFSTINGIADNIPAAGHASKYAILGKVSFAPWRAKCVEPLD